MGESAIEESVVFEAAGERLEGVLAYPEAGRPDAAWLILAPHPHMGGRMENNLVRHLARRGAACGAATLRFDYRGVGRSTLALPEGTSLYDHFAALERERRYEALLPDAAAAWTTLTGAAGVVSRRVLVGYSLGAVLAGMLAPGLDVTHVVGVSPPTARVPLDAYRAVRPPVLFLGGDADFAFDPARFEEQRAALPRPVDFVSLAGADHFFRREEERVFEAIGAWLDRS